MMESYIYSSGGGSAAKINVSKRPTIMEKLHGANIVISVNHKGEVNVLKNKYHDINEPIPPVDMVDLCTQFIADSCVNQMSGGPVKFSMFKDGMAIEIKKVLAKYMEENDINSGKAEGWK